MRLRTTRGLFALCLLACVVLAACSVYTKRQLEQLHLPNVQRVQALSSLQTDESGRINGMTAFRSTDGQTRFLVLGDHEVYEASEDGHVRPTGLYCRESPAVTPDGMWAVCPDHSDVAAAGVQMVSLTSDQSMQHIALQTGYTGRARITQAVWSPDGKYLAVIQTSVDGGSCAPAFYAFDPSGQTFSPPIILDIMDAGGFSNITCVVHSLSWRPDGKWLALSVGYQIPLVLLSQAELSRVLSRVPTHPTTLKARDILAVDALRIDRLLAPTSWNPVSGALAYLSGHSILAYSPETGEQTLLLALPADAAPIRTLTWKPDGSALYFAVGYDWCIECANPDRSDVYALTPSAAAPTIPPASTPVPVTPPPTVPLPTATPFRPTPARPLVFRSGG